MLNFDKCGKSQQDRSWPIWPHFYPTCGSKCRDQARSSGILPLALSIATSLSVCFIVLYLSVFLALPPSLSFPLPLSPSVCLYLHPPNLYIAKSVQKQNFSGSYILTKLKWAPLCKTCLTQIFKRSLNPYVQNNHFSRFYKNKLKDQRSCRHFLHFIGYWHWAFPLSNSIFHPQPESASLLRRQWTMAQIKEEWTNVDKQCFKTSNTPSTNKNHKTQAILPHIPPKAQGAG